MAEIKAACWKLFQESLINTTKQYISSCEKLQHPRIQSIERMELFLLNVYHIWRRPRQLLSYILSLYPIHLPMPMLKGLAWQSG
ncbi:MAG: hypothetical protein EBU30_11160, partial [Synechococcaceae bacterium WB6_3B_236]|nr:hypothetical protein [Synechococcaceae bacterium WB6_3B_236]